MKNLITIFLIMLIIGCDENPKKISHIPQNNITPTPKEIKYLSNEECLKLPTGVKVYSPDESLNPIATIFVEQLNQLDLKHQLSFEEEVNANISLLVDDKLEAEEFHIITDQKMLADCVLHK